MPEHFCECRKILWALGYVTVKIVIWDPRILLPELARNYLGNFSYSISKTELTLLVFFFLPPPH